MTPIDPTDNVQFETLHVNNKQRVVILTRHLDIRQGDNLYINGFNARDIVVYVSDIIFPTKFVSLDPIFYNVRIETSLPMGPIVRGPSPFI